MIHVPQFHPPITRLRLPDMWSRHINTSQVNTDYFYNGSVWLSVRSVSWHTDEDFPPHSALLIVRNSGVAIHAWNHGEVVPAAGDLVLLNVHKKHKATQKNPKAKMLCLAHDFDTEPTIEEIRQQVKTTLRIFRQQVSPETRY